MKLPFLVVHGALFWKLLLCALVGGTLALFAWRRQKNERARVRALVATDLGNVTPLAPGPVILRGTIKRGSASTRTVGVEHTSERSAELVLDHTGEEIAIEGTVTALRLFRSDLSTYSLDHLPFQFLDDIAWYRRLSVAIGDTEQAVRWQALFDRHAALLRDRQKLTAYLLLHDF